LGHTLFDSGGFEAARVGNKVLSWVADQGSQPRHFSRRPAHAPSEIGGWFESRDTATRLKQWPPDAAHSEGASRAWATRRHNQFNAAIRFLTITPAIPANLARLQFELHFIGEQLAAHLPENADALPRGYRATTNGFGEPAIAFGEVFFNPSYTAPAPGRELIERAANDLKTGWLREVPEATGAVLDFTHAKGGVR